MYWRHSGMGAGGWILMAFGMVLFWTVVAVLIIGLIRYVNRVPQQHEHVPTPFADRPPTQPAEQILAERFARGDIDEDEYQRRLRTLREAGG